MILPAAGAMARSIVQHTRAHTAPPASTFIRSSPVRFSPRPPSRRDRLRRSTAMAVAPASVVARARPLAPISARRMKFKITFSTTARQPTRKGVLVSFMAWKARFSRSRRPKVSTPMT